MEIRKHDENDVSIIFNPAYDHGCIGTKRELRLRKNSKFGDLNDDI